MKLVLSVATWRARRPYRYSPDRWRSVSTLKDQEVARWFDASSCGLLPETASRRKTPRSPVWLTNGGSGLLPHETKSNAAAIDDSVFTPNDQITDGGPSVTPELPGGAAGPPFGAAPGWASGVSECA